MNIKKGVFAMITQRCITKRLSLIVFVLVIFAFTIIIILPYVASAAWTIETIDTENVYNSSIAIDSNNNVHISYFYHSVNDFEGNLKYATNSSGNWVAEVIDSPGNLLSGSIATDSNNKVHISYRDYDGDLKYATNSSGTWVIDYIDSFGGSSSIAIDSNNKVHIIYYGYYSPHDLKYATNSSGTWVKKVIDDTGNVSNSSMAIDSNNKVHISYRDYDGDLKYATNSSGTWITEVIDDTGNVESISILATDSNNKVHISYRGHHNDLEYATNSSGTWVVEYIGIDSNGFSSTDIDSNNKVHIIFYKDDCIQYVTNSSGIWVTESIYGTKMIGWNPSIAIDSNNKVHINYCVNGNLKYVTNALTTHFVNPPSSITVKANSSSSIVLTWTDNSDNELGFKIERKEGKCDSANTWKQIAKKGANVTTHTNSGLAPNTTYSYRVRAYNADGNSDYSNCASAKTALSGTPKAPTNLKARSVSSSKVNLSWNDNSSDETGFKVYRKSGTGIWTLLATPDADAISYSDITATGNTSTTTYSYYIKACNSTGCSPQTTVAVIPYKPVGLTATSVSLSQINLTWTDKSNKETGFEIYRKSGVCSSTNSWSKIKATGSNVSSYSNTGLTSGTTYSYKTRAYKRSSVAPYAYGYSAYSNCKSATTP